jgi:hypothetical protein
LHRSQPYSSVAGLLLSRRPERVLEKRIGRIASDHENVHDAVTSEGENGEDPEQEHSEGRGDP